MENHRLSLSSPPPPAATAATEEEGLRVQPPLWPSARTKRVDNDGAADGAAKDSKRGLIHLVAGATGGMIGAVFTSPLDVVKTRLQSDFYRQTLAQRRKAAGLVREGSVRAGIRHFSETLSIIRDIYRIEGPRALFAGLGPNLVGVIPARSINFFVYGNGKRILADRFSEGQESSVIHLVAAASAGIITSTATNPIWLIKTRLQLDRQALEKGASGGRAYHGSWDCIKKTFRHEGIRGFYRGLSASYLGVTESTMHWVVYERLKGVMSNQRWREAYDLPPSVGTALDWAGKMGSAGLAKFLAAAITYPHEVIRTRLRQDGGYQRYGGLINCIRIVYREEGLTALYGGLTAHLLRVVPNSAIMFGSYELILSLA